MTVGIHPNGTLLDVIGQVADDDLEGLGSGDLLSGDLLLLLLDRWDATTACTGGSGTTTTSRTGAAASGTSTGGGGGTRCASLSTTGLGAGLDELCE